jgi:hypothetical protein
MRSSAMQIVDELPQRIADATNGLSDAQLDTAYRPGGWTVRQLVHHVADSHMNAYLRLKLALTETNPTIKPYDQDRSAALPDSHLPVQTSLKLLDGLHERWTTVYRSLAPQQFARTFVHPEIGVVSIDEQLQMYAWHSRHHVAHITAMRQRLHF